MSTLDVVSALSIAINSVTPAIDTEWENIPYTPIVDIPYQSIKFFDFRTDNPEVNGPLYNILSIVQIDLMYPLLKGTGDILARAELYKNLFQQSATFVYNGQTVYTIKTPFITKGGVDGDRWKVTVKIFYSAWVNF